MISIANAVSVLSARVLVETETNSMGENNPMNVTEDMDENKQPETKPETDGLALFTATLNEKDFTELKEKCNLQGCEEAPGKADAQKQCILDNQALQESVEESKLEECLEEFLKNFGFEPVGKESDMVPVETESDMSGNGSGNSDDLNPNGLGSMEPEIVDGSDKKDPEPTVEELDEGNMEGKMGGEFEVGLTSQEDKMEYAEVKASAMLRSLTFVLVL